MVDQALSAAAAVILSVGGGGAIVWALSSWFGRLWAERILEHDRQKYAEQIERLRGELERTTRHVQAELDKTVFVHRLHFETEFHALRTVWRELSLIEEHATTAIVDYSRLALPEAQKDSETTKLELEYMQKIVRGARRINAQRPFIPEPIYHQATVAVFVSRGHATRFKTPRGARDEAWRTSANEGSIAVSKAVEQVVGLIRQRVASLALYRDGAAAGTP